MKTPKINQALEILQKDEEESKLIYGYKIAKTFNEVCLDILIDEAIASKYRTLLTACLGVHSCKTTRACWNLPLEFVEKKYSDVVEFTFKFEDN